MAATPTASKLSSSLKDRLKKCGRYHSSPYQSPVARQPAASLVSSSKDQPQNMCKPTQVLTDNKKQQQKCDSTVHDGISMEDAVRCETQKCDSDMHHCDGDLKITNTDLKSGAEGPHSKLGDAGDGAPGATFRTPVNVRSRSSLKVRGNRLTFTDTMSCDLGDTPADGSPDESYLESNIPCDSGDNSKVSCDVKPLEKSGLSSDGSSITDLEKQIAEKEELLRKLNMVKMYRSKNNLHELERLIHKWRGVSQQSLQDLHSAMVEPRPSLTQLVNHLGIDHTLVKFSADDDESFY